MDTPALGPKPAPLLVFTMVTGLDPKIISHLQAQMCFSCKHLNMHCIALFRVVLCGVVACCGVVLCCVVTIVGLWLPRDVVCRCCLSVWPAWSNSVEAYVRALDGHYRELLRLAASTDACDNESISPRSQVLSVQFY